MEQDYYFKSMLFFWALYTSNNPGKMYIMYVSINTVFNLDHFKKFIEHQISILKVFLKNHVTLKTEVMTEENSALPSQE